jgi:hypothetical protein
MRRRTPLRCFRAGHDIDVRVIARPIQHSRTIDLMVGIASSRVGLRDRSQYFVASRDDVCMFSRDAHFVRCRVGKLDIGDALDSIAPPQKVHS